MKYIFFIAISMTPILVFIYKKKSIYLISFLTAITCLIIIYPQISLSAAKDGINLWIFVVLPSLLPFFIINDMLISLKVPENISRLFTPIARVLFHTSGYGAYVFIMSIFSGYPTGAKITGQLVESKKISSDEGQKILTFSSTSGPLFIIGVVGSAMLKSTAAGYILIISHILGAIINGSIFGILLKSKDSHKVNFISTGNQMSVGDMISKAILNSLITSGLIGGYIVLFSVIIELLNKVEFFAILANVIHYIMFIPNDIAQTISYLIETSLEISNGAKIITAMPLEFETKMIFLSFIIAFSGLSIIGQVSSLISRTKIKLNIYILSKISHGLLSSVLTYIFLNANLFNVSAIKHFSSNRLLPNELSILQILLIILLLLNIPGSKIKNK